MGAANHFKTPSASLRVPLTQRQIVSAEKTAAYQTASEHEIIIQEGLKKRKAQEGSHPLFSFMCYLWLIPLQWLALFFQPQG